MSSVIKLQSPFERLKLENKSPEIALARAIILQAIIDASSTCNSKRSKKITKEAKQWLFEDVINFEEICTDAEFEPDYVRNIAKQMILLNQNKQLMIEKKQNGASQDGECVCT